MATQLDTTSRPALQNVPASPVAATMRPRISVARVLLAIRSHWLLILIGFSLTAASAYAGSSFMTKKTWESSTTLLYAPLPTPADGHGLYTQPDLKTLSGLVTSPDLIERLREDFRIKVPGKAIEKNVSVVIPNGTKMLTVTLRWDNGPQTVDMLNRLAADFIARVTELRRQKLATHLDDFAQALVDVQVRHEVAIKAVREFHKRENLSEYKNDLVSENAKIVDFESLLAQHHRTEMDTLAQVKRMCEHLEEVKAEQARESEKNKQFEAATESVTDNRRRQDRLRELIQDERRVQEVQAQLFAKKAELDRVRKLHSKQFASLSQVQELEGQVHTLTTQIKDSEKIRNWQAELDRIDKVVVPEGTKKNVGSPIIQQVLFRKLELELQLTATRQEIGQLETQLTETRAHVSRIESLHGEYESLVNKVEAIEEERKGLELQSSGIRNLRSLQTGEFVVVNPAIPSEYPVASNKKTLLAGFLGLGLFLTFGAVASLETVSTMRGCESRAQRLGLPILARIPGDHGVLQLRELRGLTLRLRQYLPTAGAVAVFSTITENGNADETLDEIASLLALRDERVLILDARIQRSEASGASVEDSDETWSEKKTIEMIEPSTRPPGLTDYLSFACTNIDEICVPAEGFGIDRVSAGLAPLTTEALATHRMSELVVELRQRYSIVLMIAPSLAHSVDLQILAAHADGLLVLNEGRPTSRDQIDDTLSELSAVNAPILGQILLELPKVS